MQLKHAFKKKLTSVFVTLRNWFETLTKACLSCSWSKSAAGIHDLQYSHKSLQQWSHGSGKHWGSRLGLGLGDYWMEWERNETPLIKIQPWTPENNWLEANCSLKLVCSEQIEELIKPNFATISVTFADSQMSYSYQTSLSVLHLVLNKEGICIYKDAGLYSSPKTFCACLNYPNTALQLEACQIYFNLWRESVCASLNCTD